MHILISNDDGIRAPGIRALYQSLSTIARITIVAPDRERSAASQGLTIRTPLRIERTFIDTDTDNIEAWQVDGTPADCVKLALDAMNIVPDLIVTGINNGANVAHDTLYSGTVGAALEGALHNIPSIAISLAFFDRNAQRDFEPAAKFIRRLAVTTIKEGLPSGLILNVNVPNISENDIKGVKITCLGELGYEDPIICRQDPSGQPYYWISGRPYDRRNDILSDLTAVKNGFISITPLVSDLTAKDHLENFTVWNY